MVAILGRLCLYHLDLVCSIQLAHSIMIQEILTQSKVRRHSNLCASLLNSIAPQVQRLGLIPKRIARTNSKPNGNCGRGIYWQRRHERPM